MDDDFFDEEENLLDEDEALDYILYEEMEKETTQTPKNTGCLASLVVMISAIGCLAIATIWIIR